MEAAFIIKILNVIQAGFSFLESRGLTRDRVQNILDAHQNGDIPSDVVQAELDALGSELEETAEQLGQ